MSAISHVIDMREDLVRLGTGGGMLIRAEVKGKQIDQGRGRSRKRRSKHQLARLDSAWLSSGRNDSRISACIVSTSVSS
jgi:hypothetical protein